MRGKIDADSGNNSEAVKWFDKALKIDPKNIVAISHKEAAQKG